jgi:hypothetical protein
MSFGIIARLILKERVMQQNQRQQKQRKWQTVVWSQAKERHNSMINSFGEPKVVIIQPKHYERIRKATNTF